MVDQYGHTDGCGCRDASAGAGRAAAAGRQFRASVDNSSWDGPAAMSACSKADTPASCFGAICAGKKSGDSSTQDGWALPHHKSPGDPPNANGVRNALARIGQTEGLTNKAAAQSHLEAHMKVIDGADAKGLAHPHLARAEAYQGVRLGPTAEAARLMPAAAYFKRESVLVNGKAMEQLDGYAAVTGVEYEMYDMFGVYYEKVAPTAFDNTLAANPDVAFLLNHRGMTMARTTNGTLELDADPRGLHSRALVNPDRSDVRDLLIAIDDKNVTEMSFAFMLTDGEWDEEFMHFEIAQVDIDRGDVSAVNFGANPYTSIGARAREVLADLAHLPLGAQRAAWDMLQGRFADAPLLRRDAGDGWPSAEVFGDPQQRSYGTSRVAAAATDEGMSAQYVEQMLRLDE